MTKNNLLADFKNGLIVSAQARKGWPMYGEEIMGAFANAADIGGAVGIRATEPKNILAIKKKTDLPIIGINKQWYNGYEVYITPTYESAESIINAGASIIALDGTMRKRPNNETLKGIIDKIKHNYPHILIMADCATLEDGINAERVGADIVSTTLRGYTTETKHITEVDFKLIESLTSALDIPIFAEGHVHTKKIARKAIESGAHSVVVGTAITRPEIITSWFVNELNKINQ